MTAPLPTGVDGNPVLMDRVPWAAVASGVIPLGVTSLPLSNLTDDEARLVSALDSAVKSQRFTLELRDSYYRGEQRISDLGVSIPPQLRGLRVSLGWPRVAVDALDERLDIEGFRYPDSPDVDADLQEIWTGNAMDCESQIANLDALVFDRGFVAAGSGDSGDMPLISVESPLDMAVQEDARRRTITAALRVFGSEQDRQATLYLPNATLSLAADGAGWSVIDRDDHNLGVVPVVRISNRPRSYNRMGASEITPEIMSITDAACRTLLGLEVAREFYSAPQRYILGASESAFQDAQGNPKSAWETYLGRVLALERDEDGNLPTVGQFTPYNPAVFTEVIDMYAKIISSITGLPPHVLGYTTDNPASADAIRSTEMRLKLKADRKTRMFGSAWARVMQLALMIRDGATPDNLDQIVTVWADTATPTPAATTDAITKQVAAGLIPAKSEVALERLGYNAVERQRLAAERAADEGEQFLAELAKSTIAKEARVDNSLAADVAKPPPTPEPGSAAVSS